MSAEIELINEEYLSVKFQFNQNLVNQIRNLHSRRWNPQKKRWEVHIAHLAELMRILTVFLIAFVFYIYITKWN